MSTEQDQTETQHINTIPQELSKSLEEEEDLLQIESTASRPEKDFVQAKAPELLKEKDLLQKESAKSLEGKEDFPQVKELLVMAEKIVESAERLANTHLRIINRDMLTNSKQNHNPFQLPPQNKFYNERRNSVISSPVDDHAKHGKTEQGRYTRLNDKQTAHNLIKRINDYLDDVDDDTSISQRPYQHKPPYLHRPPTCFYCKRKGHLKRECRLLRQKMEQNRLAHDLTD